MGGGELSRAKERWRSRWTGSEELLRAKERWRPGDGQRVTWDEDDGAGGMRGWMRRRRMGAEGGICEILTSKGQSWRGGRLPWRKNYGAKRVV